MRLTDFDYELPPDRIAQTPIEPRDAARLLVDHGLRRPSTVMSSDLPDLLRAGRSGRAQRDQGDPGPAGAAPRAPGEPPRC